MTVKELIKQLQSLGKKRQNYLIRVIEGQDYYEDWIKDVEVGEPKANHWINDVEVSDKGNSGYEQQGEIRLIGSE